MKIRGFVCLVFWICWITSLELSAQDFGRFFSDSTLRLDCQMSGNKFEQKISIGELLISSGWYGKRDNLREIPMEGNGQIEMRDHKTKKMIFKNSFSTLFQEWLSCKDAKTETRSFENVFLLPMPKDSTDLLITLFNGKRERTSELSFLIDPQDILIRKIGLSQVLPFEILQEADKSRKCIHVAILPEGYTEEEMPQFLKDARIAQEALFSHEPFKSYRSRFNIVAVKAPSPDSGTSEPAKGIWKNTALHSHFDTFHMSRYLTTLHLQDMHDLLSGIPYEHIIVLVNTNQYGGGGILNAYTLTAAHDPWFEPVVVHEFGHSFAGLADEYAYEGEEDDTYPEDVEPWEPNITTLTDFNAKWKNLLPKDYLNIFNAKNNKRGFDESQGEEQTIGLYEGAGYRMKGIYRSSKDCRMRTNKCPSFCEVCRGAIEKVIKFYTD